MSEKKNEVGKENGESNLVTTKALVKVTKQEKERRKNEE